jgi:hypothetical protein
VRKSAVLLLLLAALLLSACGGGSSSSSGSSTTAADTGAAAGESAKATTPEEVWAKEVEGVMRRFENSSADSVALMHTNVSQLNLEPTYTTYSAELAKLGKDLEATKPPAECEHLVQRMGALSRKVSDILGVLAHQPQLSPEEYSALVFQQRYKFAHVGQKLTTITIEPHC